MGCGSGGLHDDPQGAKAVSGTQPHPDVRERLVRLIHVGKRDLGLDDETYRAMLVGCVNKDSTKAMTVQELERVLERMKRNGFKIRTKNKSGPPTSYRTVAQYPEARKIRALWLFLCELGAVANPAEAALAAYVKRITGVEALQWLNGRQMETVIETMKKWAMRFLPGQVLEMTQALSMAIKSGDITLSGEELDALRGAVGLAQDRRTFDVTWAAWEGLKAALTTADKIEKGSQESQ
jgi:phage gp16-like protein